MSVIGYKSGVLCMEDVPLEKIAEQVGTPVYCYSTEQLADNFHAYQSAMRGITDEKNFTICYAAKSNSNQAVLHMLHRLGAGADVVSGGEMYRAFRAGMTAKKMVFSGVGKTEAELTKAIKNGLFQINVESESELMLIAKIAVRENKEANIAFRINPDVDARTHAKISTGQKEHKFGIDIKDAVALYHKARALTGINVAGVAVHIGSQIMDLTPFEYTFRRVADLVTALREDGHTITVVDLGGGLGIPYKNETPPSLETYINLIRDIILPLNVHVVLEPGRSISGNAGVLLSRVLHIKDGQGKKFVILDAGMNDLLRPALYGAHHPVIPCKETSADAIRVRCDVVGPVCETGDTFLVDEEMPVPAQGDLIAIGLGGAYGAVMSSNYNTRPLVPEVLVSATQFDLIRKIQKIEELVDNDVIPEWLK